MSSIPLSELDRCDSDVDTVALAEQLALAIGPSLPTGPQIQQRCEAAIQAKLDADALPSAADNATATRVELLGTQTFWTAVTLSTRPAVDDALADAVGGPLLTAAQAQAAAEAAIDAKAAAITSDVVAGLTAYEASTLTQTQAQAACAAATAAIITQAYIEAACAAALAAHGASTLTQAEAEAACAAALTAAGIPAATAALISPAYVQAACAAAIVAAGLPSSADVQALLVNATSQATYQAGAQAALTASIGGALLTQAQAQTAAGAALTAYSASTLTSAQVQALLVNATSTAAYQAGAAAAITAAGLPNSAGVQAACAAALAAYGVSTLTQTQVQAACTASINSFLGTPVRINGVFAGAGTSQAIIAAPGAGLRIAILSATFSVGGAVTTGLQLSSAGGDSTSSHNIAVGGSIQFGGDSFIPVLIGGSNVAYTLTKTTLATIIYDVRYRII